MSFDELYETLLNAAKSHNSFSLNMVKTSKETYHAIYEHGAASRQAEIDELQNRIDNAIEKIESFDRIVDVHSVYRILKGEQND